MRDFLPLASILCLFSSCTTYQYMAVQGKNINANDRQEYVVENDSLRITYNFHGQDAPINVEVKNKLDKPIYVDWSRSALIINEKAISYSAATVPVSGTVTSTSYSAPAGSLRSSVSQGNFSGSMGVPKDMEFIPPGSYKNKTPLGVTNVFYPEARNEGQWQQISINTYNGGVIYGRAMVKKYEDTLSPFRFSSYLTIYVEGEPDKPVSFEHDFFVSEIWTTTRGPRNFQFINSKDGNWFYTRTTNGFGKIAGGFGILAGYALVTWAEVQSQEFAEKRGVYRYYRR